MVCCSEYICRSLACSRRTVVVLVGYFPTKYVFVVVSSQNARVVSSTQLGNEQGSV